MYNNFTMATHFIQILIRVVPLFWPWPQPFLVLCPILSRQSGPVLNFSRLAFFLLHLLLRRQPLPPQRSRHLESTPEPLPREERRCKRGQVPQSFWSNLKPEMTCIAAMPILRFSGKNINLMIHPGPLVVSLNLIRLYTSMEYY